MLISEARGVELFWEISVGENDNEKCTWLSGILVFTFLLTVPCMISNTFANESFQNVSQRDSDETPSLSANLEQRLGALVVNPFTGTIPVYFTPSDHNGTATVIVLYNTSTSTQTAHVQAFTSGGSLQVNTDVVLTPFERKYLISDPLVSSPPDSFSNNILVNFTDLSTVGVLFIPEGVSLDGYVVFNGSGEIDPRTDQGAIPLLFSTTSTKGSRFFVIPLGR